ncbi:hypothetical protein Y900_017620 [Mycolicibacterium aromaticivorans JS19b1 = JCM 16368]|uniref:Uncharacterized protein n=1 Tax=Mycolicibacterium aromaticivorans JS19b1 = JCM 16368 TaxID=1440774 RepID=A0A064CPH0_9MYCO|nr:hypothetical protein Y900_017620 [Mycolicibacterium aromaticivorans JS19b1 = JCM 16368]
MGFEMAGLREYARPWATWRPRPCARNSVECLLVATVDGVFRCETGLVTAYEMKFNGAYTNMSSAAFTSHGSATFGFRASLPNA